jgi:hypothetical protein
MAPDHSNDYPPVQQRLVRTVRFGLAPLMVLAAIAIWLAASPAALGENLLTMTADALADLRDQALAVTHKSQEGYIDAAKEFETQKEAPVEKSIDYNLRKYGELTDALKHNVRVYKAQTRLTKIDAELLKKLPKEDPFRAEIMKELVGLSPQLSEVNKKVREFAGRRKEFHDLIQDYKKRTGSYPPHNCASAPGWHLPQGASCEGSPANDPHGGSTQSPAPSGHHGP